MKRAVKLWQEYKNDGINFSNCSTYYEVLPFVVSSDAGELELQSIACFLGLKVGTTILNEVSDRRRNKGIKTTEAMPIIGELKNKVNRFTNKVEDKMQVYLAFLEIGELKCVPVVENLKGKFTDEMFTDVMNGQYFDFENTGEMGDDYILIVSGWDAFHYTALYGYEDFDTLLKKLKIDEHYFSDSVFSCGECGVYDHNDNGYTYNYRIIDSEICGVNCGCAKDLAIKNIDTFCNNPKTCVEVDVLENLDATLLETFIGGMVDGRGGYINGKTVRESSPEMALKEYSEKHNAEKLFFVREDSGQFQTYFSIYKLNS